MSVSKKDPVADGVTAQRHSKDQKDKSIKKPATEIGGQSGPEPTRYGDWEKNGIISDF